MNGYEDLIVSVSERRGFRRQEEKGTKREAVKLDSASHSN